MPGRGVSRLLCGEFWGASRSRPNRKDQMRQLACWVAGVAITLCAVPTAYGDVATDYHPDQQARDFAAGPGGWTGSQMSAGVCVQQLTCPTVTTTWEAS